MAGNIKGIIVEIGGDTSGLQKALKNVNSATASLSKELKQVNSLLKLDPKNTELLAQKQTVLKESIKETENRIKLLHSTFQRYQETEANGQTISEDKWRAIQRELIEAEQDEKKLTEQLINFKNENSKWNKTGNYLTNLGSELDSVSQKIDSLGSKLTTRLTLPITAVATAGISYNAEIEKMTTAFTTFLGDAKEAERVVENIKTNAAKTPFDVKSLVQANQMLISTGENAEDAQETIMALGDAITATGGGNSELERMSANLQQIKNAGKATALDIKQFAYAGIDIYGLLADSMGKSVKQVKDMDISYEDLTKALKKANKEGGKYYNAMNNASETLTGQVNQLKSEFKDMTGQLTKSLMPTAKKLVSRSKDLIAKFDNLSDSQKDNIVKIGLMVAAAGPLLKIGSSAISIVGNVTSGIGTLTKAIGLAHNGIGTATGSAATLAKVLQGLISPAGLAAVGITTAVGIIVAKMAKAEAETKKKFETMGNSAQDFYNGIQTAEGYLDRFNDTMFASSQEQQALEDEMQKIQDGITKICKTASDERRDYTQKEVTQLDEYFTKLRELEQRELEIQQHKAEAITQAAQTESEAFKGSLEEYKELTTQWIATAQQQADEQIKAAERNRIDTIALLNSQYSEEERIDNEEYQRKVAQAEADYQLAVDMANKQVGEVSSIYAKGYADRANQDGDFAEHIKHYNWEYEQEETRHTNALKSVEYMWWLDSHNKLNMIRDENETHAKKMNKVWQDMYKYMSESEAEQLGVWLGMLAQTELYGGEISEENQKLVNSIIDSYDSMPKKTREAMKNAMSPMLEEMKNSEPSLYAKASGIAEGVLSRLKKSFDIHSPSKETRKIFENVMKGSELGLKDEEKTLYDKTNEIANKMKTRLADITPNIGSIKQSVIDQTRTVFTTPNIIINAQDELSPAKINSIINAVNRRLGSQY